MNNIRHIVGLVLNTKDRRDSSSTASELDERFLTTLLEHQDSLKSRNGAALEILIEHSGVITSSGAARYCQAMFIMTWAEGNKFFDNLPFFTEDVLYKLIERRHAEWLIQGCIIGAMQGVVWLNKNQLWEPNHGIAFLGALYGAFLYSKSKHGKLSNEMAGELANIAFEFVQACHAGLPDFFHSLHNSAGNAFGEGGRIDDSPLFHQLVSEICVKATRLLTTEGKVRAMASIFDPRFEMPKKETGRVVATT